MSMGEAIAVSAKGKVSMTDIPCMHRGWLLYDLPVEPLIKKMLQAIAIL